MDVSEKFRAWLDEEIENLKPIRDEAPMFIHGKFSEAIRIRAMLCQIDKECEKNAHNG